MKSCAVPTESLPSLSDAWMTPAADICCRIVAAQHAARAIDRDQTTWTACPAAYEAACRTAPKIRPRHATSRTMPNTSNRPVDGSGTAAKVRVVGLGREMDGVPFGVLAYCWFAENRNPFTSSGRVKGVNWIVGILLRFKVPQKDSK